MHNIIRSNYLPKILRSSNKYQYQTHYPYPRFKNPDRFLLSIDPEMVSDSDLVTRLRDILRSSDLDTTTAGAVRRQLEKEFSVDLSERKKFISQQIDEFLEERGNNVNEEEEVENDVVGGEVKDEDEEEEEEEEDEDDDEGEVVNASRKGKSKNTEGDTKKRGGGFTKICSLSPQLQEFVGCSELARTEVVKKLWAYIRENNLQDPENKRNIQCDEKLRALFRVDKINMFQMNKVLSKHIWPLDEKDEPAVKTSPKEKQNKREKEEGKPKAKRQKGGPSGFLIPLRLSDALVKFLGTGEKELSRSDVVKRMWGYIKQEDLQDPSDKRRIICDDKLKELFDVDSFNGFLVTKLLKDHLNKVDQ